MADQCAAPRIRVVMPTPIDNDWQQTNLFQSPETASQKSIAAGALQHWPSRAINGARGLSLVRLCGSC